MVVECDQVELGRHDVMLLEQRHQVGDLGVVGSLSLLIALNGGEVDLGSVVRFDASLDVVRNSEGGDSDEGEMLGHDYSLNCMGLIIAHVISAKSLNLSKRS